MPTYDYNCEKCGHKFEAFQSMMDEPLKNCPECNGRVRRLISTGAGIIFKGKGFYQTDYKSSCSDIKAASGKGDKKPLCGGSCNCPNKQQNETK
ncbi:MAG: FmdB family zinc ribbon protein [Candidatus Omnitrophota bacterium]